MTSSVLVSAFFDELTKIGTAGDLMTPAVVSDSAVVDGPPATPFARKRGFKKLEQVSHLSKEAGLGRDFLAWAHRARRKTGKTVAKIDEAQRNLGIKAYMKMPEPVQKAVTNPMVMDPSDQRTNPAFSAAARMLKVGSAQKNSRR